HEARHLAMCIPPDRGSRLAAKLRRSAAMLAQGFRAPTAKPMARASRPAWTRPHAAHHNTSPNTDNGPKGGIDMAQGGETPNERPGRVFLETLSSGDLEALRPQIHVDGSWEATGTSIPGAGITRGRDKIIDELLAPVRGLFVPGDPKIKILRIFSKDEWVAA